MKKTVALLLAFVMVLSMAACGKKKPSTNKPDSPAATTPTVETVEDDAFTHTFTQYGNARIKIVGAEATQNDWGEDLLRIFYDYTNTDNTANGHYPYTVLNFLSITQDGEERKIYHFQADDETARPEDLNQENYIQPGCTNRNTINILWDPNGGIVKVSCYIMIGTWAYDKEDIIPFEFEIDPDNLTGAPETFVLAPITNPTYTSGMSASGKYDYPLDSEISIKDIELTKDADGTDVIRVNLTVTNNGEEALTPALMCLLELYQDGVSLPQVDATWDMDSNNVTAGDNAYQEDLAPGETVDCSALFYPRNQNPVEAVIENVNSELCLGTRFDVKALFDAAAAKAAAAASDAAAAAEAASAADKAILKQMVGSWDRTNTWPDHITFKADLTGVHDMTGDLFPFTYIVTDGVLYLTYEDGEVTDYKISVSGNDMVLTNTFYQEEQIFARAATAEAPAATESPAPTEAPKKEDPYAHLATDILGCWMDEITGENESFTFNKGGTGLYTWMNESCTFTYTLTDDIIEIFFEDGDYSSFDTSIEGNTLYLAGWPLERQN